MLIWRDGESGGENSAHRAQGGTLLSLAGHTRSAHHGRLWLLFALSSSCPTLLRPVSRGCQHHSAGPWGQVICGLWAQRPVVSEWLAGGTEGVEERQRWAWSRSSLTHSTSRDNQEIKPGSRRSFVPSRPLLARGSGGGNAANLPPTIFYTIFYPFLPPPARLSQTCGIGRVRVTTPRKRSKVCPGDLERDI